MRYAFCLMLLVSVSSTGLAQDWPRWRGPDNTGRARTGALRALPTAPRVVWRAPLGTGHGSPAVAGGRVFIMEEREGREAIRAFDAATGRDLWRAELDPVFTDSGSKPGPRATPTVDGDRVYVQTCRGEFQCRRTRDGAVVWRTNFVQDLGSPAPAEAGEAMGAQRHGYTAAPLVDGGRLYVSAGSPRDASVVCFDKLTGRVIWKSHNEVAGHSGPVLATLAGRRQLVCFSAESVAGLQPADGRVLWRVPVRSTFGRHVMTPVVVGDTVVVGSHTAGLIGIRVTSSGGTPAAQQAWVQRSLAVNFSSPVAVGKHVYGLGPARRLFCVDAATGQPAWTHESIFSGAVTTDHVGFAAVGAGILALTDSGHLVLVGADPTGCRELGRARVCGENWCSPAYAGTRLYVRDTEELRCVDLAP